MLVGEVTTSSRVLVEVLLWLSKKVFCHQIFNAQRQRFQNYRRCKLRVVLLAERGTGIYLGQRLGVSSTVFTHTLIGHKRKPYKLANVDHRSNSLSLFNVSLP